MPSIAPLTTSRRTPLLQVAKTSIAVVAAWGLSVLLVRQELPIFAAIAALLVVQPSVNQSLAKGIERSAGVILGVALAYGAGFVVGGSSLAVLAIVVAALLLGWALRLTPGSAVQIPISAMLVLAIGAQSPAYAVDRILETIIGAVVGLAVNAAIVPPVLVRPAHEAVAATAERVARAMERLAELLRGAHDRAELDAALAEARLIRPAHTAAEADLARARESLTLNPRARRHRAELAHDTAVHARLAVLVTRVIGMTRAVHDTYDRGLAEDPVAAAIAQELTRAAHDVRLLVRDASVTVERVTEDRAPITAEMPALTSPLVVLQPDPEHWILVGSLLEDLRRVREEIVGVVDE